MEQELLERIVKVTEKVENATINYQQQIDKKSKELDVLIEKNNNEIRSIISSIQEQFTEVEKNKEHSSKIINEYKDKMNYLIKSIDDSQSKANEINHKYDNINEVLNRTKEMVEKLAKDLKTTDDNRVFIDIFIAQKDELEEQLDDVGNKIKEDNELAKTIKQEINSMKIDFDEFEKDLQSFKKKQKEEIDSFEQNTITEINETNSKILEAKRVVDNFTSSEVYNSIKNDKYANFVNRVSDEVYKKIMQKLKKEVVDIVLNNIDISYGGVFGSHSHNLYKK